MRKMLMSSVTVVFLTLAGCTTTQVTDFLKLVQADTAVACMFVPTIDTILAVAAALGIPATAIIGGAITTVANAICSQVPPPASAKYQALAPVNSGAAKLAGTFNGVPITGWRTR